MKRHRYGGREWRWMRQHILKRDKHTCQIRLKCSGAPATQIDHKIPLSIRPDLRLDQRNLQASCSPCNRAKQALDRTAAGQKRIRELCLAMPEAIPNPWDNLGLLKRGRARAAKQL